MIVLNSGYELWNSLVDQAGLDLKRYDSEIETNLRQYLSFPENGDIASLINDHKISPEVLLAGFFTTLQPFTEMFSDILKLIVEIGLREGKDNLLIHFDFDQAETQFKFDLENFRRQFEIFSKGTRSILIEHWSYSRLWDLAKQFDYDDTVTPAVKSWVSKYDAGFWDESDVAPPQSGDNDLDEKLSHVWLIRNALISGAKAVGSTLDDLRNFDKSSSNLNEIIISDGRVNLTNEVIAFLRYIHSDHWARSITTRTYAKANQARQDSDYAKQLSEKLKTVLYNPPPEKREIEDVIRNLEDLLQLPIWKYRYELYSIWILTQIVEAFGGVSQFDFLLEDDIFHIPFAAKRLVLSQGLIDG